MRHLKKTNECTIKTGERENEGERKKRKEREVFVGRLTTPHDRIVPLDAAGVDERNGGMEGEKKRAACQTTHRVLFSGGTNTQHTPRLRGDTKQTTSYHQL